MVINQLIYTSFKGVGYKLLASPGTDPDLQQTFVERVVYCRWDAYNPPDPEYRAIYLFQANSGATLFGWLYNDGADDLARCDVPYFVCYCLTGALEASGLPQLFAALQRGPAFLPGRGIEPVRLAPAPDLENYEPERPGVEVPEVLKEWCVRAVERGEGLNLFLSDGKAAQAPVAQLPTESPVAAPPQPLAPRRRVLFGAAAAGLLFTIGTLGWWRQEGMFFSPPVQPTPTVATPAPVRTQINTDRTPGWVQGQTLTGHRDTVWSVAVSPNGETLSSAGADGTVKLWNLSGGGLLRTLGGHRAIVRAVRFSPDGSLIASGASDRTLKLWNAERGTLVASLGGHAETIWAVAFSEDGLLVASGGSDQMIRIMNVKNRRLVRSFRDPGGDVWTLAFSPDGTQLASGSSDGAIRLWDVRGRLERTLKGHRSAVRTLATSRATGLLVSGSWDKTVKVWDWRSARLLRTLSGHSDRVISVALSADGRTLSSAGRDRTLKVWNTFDGRLLQTFNAHTDWVVASAFSPRGDIVSASKDRTIKLWNQVGAR